MGRLPHRGVVDEVTENTDAVTDVVENSGLHTYIEKRGRRVKPSVLDPRIKRSLDTAGKNKGVVATF